MSDERQPAERLERRHIARALACAQCSYDLRGLPIGGGCPECGLPIWDTVQGVVDPAARRLPQLRNPPKVGNALLWLVICVAGATALVLAQPVADRLMFLFSVQIMVWTPPVLTLGAGACALAGLVSAWKLAPPIRSEPRGAVWRDIWLLTIGLVGAGLSCVALWVLFRATGRFELLQMHDMEGGARLIPLLTLLASALVTMNALGGILRVIGERSREYRTAHGGRQRTRELSAAFLGVGLGVTLRQLGPLTGVKVVPVIGDIITVLCTFMLLVGLGYLLVNAGWIRRSLCAPPPTIRELLTPVVEEAEEEAEPGADAEGGEAPS